MTLVRYCSGSRVDDGQIAAHPATDWPALCAALSQPVVLPFSRREFHAMPPKERQQRKRVKFIIAAVCATLPGPRRTENAVRCNLLALDIDDEGEAARLLSEGFDGLGNLGYIAWHTASSTPEKPRLRVVVNAEGIGIARYAAAVRTVAEMLGLSTVTKESLVPVQPMFWPTMFDGDDVIEAYSPIVGAVKA